VAGDWRRLHIEDPHNLYASPSIIKVIKSRRMGLVGNVAGTGAMTNAYNILVGKFEGKRQPGRPRRRWEYNIRMYFKEIWW